MSRCSRDLEHALGDDESTRAVLEAHARRGRLTNRGTLALPAAWLELLDDPDTAASWLEELRRPEDRLTYAEGHYRLFGDPFLLMSHLSEAEALLERTGDLVSIARAWNNVVSDAQRALRCLEKADRRARSAADQAAVREARWKINRSRR